MKKQFLFIIFLIARLNYAANHDYYLLGQGGKGSSIIKTNTSQKFAGVTVQMPFYSNTEFTVTGIGYPPAGTTYKNFFKTFKDPTFSKSLELALKKDTVTLYWDNSSLQFYGKGGFWYAWIPTEVDTKEVILTGSGIKFLGGIGFQINILHPRLLVDGSFNWLFHRTKYHAYFWRIGIGYRL